MKFISQEEWKRLTEEMDESLMNEILSRVYNAAVEKTLTKIPELLSRMVKTATVTHAMTEDFFTRNASFKEHKDIVTQVVRDVESRNPDWDYTKILNHAEPLIKEKISVDIPNLECNIPEKVNLKGNGVI